MIVLFTDYGLAGPYMGQVEAVFHTAAPKARVITLFADAPRNNPKSSAYLLAAYCKSFAEDSVFFCVVDPGVGNFANAPIILKIDNRWYVGPDNGLFDIIARQAREMSSWEILWRPDKLSSSFHGRDLYAPVCAMLVNGGNPPGQEFIWKDKHQWPDDLYEIIYIDHFGNCITGIRAGKIAAVVNLEVAGSQIDTATTFSDVPAGAMFWYENANGLVEIAVNQGNASTQLGRKIGSKVKLI